MRRAGLIEEMSAVPDESYCLGEIRKDYEKRVFSNISAILSQACPSP